jgi:hypothetical protein
MPNGPISVGQIGPYGAGSVPDAELKGHRFWVQTQIGLAIAITALSSLLITVGLIAYLAIAKRDAEFIESVAQSLQPFILPTLGALVGYALREYQEQAQAN